MSNTARIEPDELTQTLNDIISEYTNETKEIVNECVKEVSKEAVKKLKRESPKRTGTYAKGWTSKVEVDEWSADATIYGKKASTYAVAHLVEFGHLTRKGTRTRPNPHVADVRKWAEKALVERVSKRLQEGQQ